MAENYTQENNVLIRRKEKPLHDQRNHIVRNNKKKVNTRSPKNQSQPSRRPLGISSESRVIFKSRTNRTLCFIAISLGS